MTDVHSAAQRSFNMSRIGSRDTRPELIVRSIVHRMGFRFRLHRSDLPGKPDIVLPSRRRIECFSTYSGEDLDKKVQTTGIAPDLERQVTLPKPYFVPARVPNGGFWFRVQRSSSLT